MSKFLYDNDIHDDDNDDTKAIAIPRVFSKNRTVKKKKKYKSNTLI